MIWRNLWRNSRRTLITIASVMFAVFLAISMQSFKNGVFNNLIKNVVGYYSGYVQIHKQGYWDEQIIDNGFMLHDSLPNILAAHSAVTGYVGRLETFMLGSTGDQTKGLYLVGTSASSEDKMTALSSRLIDGSYLLDTDTSVLLAEGLAKKFKLGVGDTIVLLGQGYQGSLAAGKFKIKGIVHLASPAMNDVFLFMPLLASQYFLNAENLVTSVSVGLEKPQYKDEINQFLKKKLNADYEVLNWEEMMPEISNHIKADSVSYFIFTGVLYLIIAFGLLGTVMMMTAERKYEFGMLVAIGMKKKYLSFMLWGETILISITGVLAGILLSLPFVIWFNRHPIWLRGEMGNAYIQFGFEPVIPTEVNLQIIITQTLIVFILSVFVGIYPIYKISSINTVEAMKR